MMKSLKLIVTVIYIVVTTTSLLAQTTNLVQLKNSVQFVIESDYFKEEPFTIEVCLPKNYDAAKSYPVVYLLDADKSIGMAKEIADWLMWGKEIQDIIIVGIAYDKDDNTWWMNRSRDFLPTLDTLSEFGKSWPKAGGADNFLDFIQKDLKPEMEKRFSIDTTNVGIIGFSFGGTLAAYTLFARPGLFDNYIIISPATVWDNNLICRLEDDYYKAGRTLDKKVFIALSSKDPGILVIEPTLALIDSLKSRKYKGLDLIYKYFENETHVSGYPMALTKGLKRIYMPDKK